MTRSGIVAVAIAAALAAGCSGPTPGTLRNLGAVGYADAFATGREVMSQYYSIASADATSGVIQSRPKSVDAPSERILSGSPARQVAKLSLRRKDNQVIAHVSVALQREGSRVYHARSESYDEVPNTTPAEELAATTPQQNEVWETRDYDHAMERRILDHLYKALHPNGK